LLEFADFALDVDRAELRRADGQTIRLRPKTLTTLHVLATNPGKVFGKSELMAAVWPSVHVGEDSLFQCIREVRAALGDERREIVKLISGRGYVFDTPVTTVTKGPPLGPMASEAGSGPPAAWARSQLHWGTLLRQPLALILLLISLGAGLAVSAAVFSPRLFGPPQLSIAMSPLVTDEKDPEAVAAAGQVAGRVTEGLSRIENLRVLAPTAAERPGATDLVLQGTLTRGAREWTLQARLIDTKSDDVRWSGSTAVALGIDPALQQSRLSAGIGHPLAVRINALARAQLPTAESRVVVEQAAAFINHASRERFQTAVAMLEKALAANPDDVDIGAALAAHMLRGIQMVWYPDGEAAEAERRARAMLERALQKEPNYLPAAVGYCRFLMTTNQFVETLVACEKALTFDPWDGMVLFQIGIAQLQLGRFEEALETFKRADAFDTPQVSRWTWLLGAGVALIVLDRTEEALPWLERSLAITPGTGRTHFMVAVVHQRAGRIAEAREAIAKGLELRPGSTVANVQLPSKNSSPVYLARAGEIGKLLIAAGLPER
jgi:DNA-binding winged helix-turn-helix (wHTH) protein/tetratricopeptide (TPR) repeat protein